MFRVVVAPDKFKGSLSAIEAADAIAAGTLDAAEALGAAVDVRMLPVSDGGDGLVAAAIAAGYEARPVTVRGPLGGPLEALLALGLDAHRTQVAVVELARASGLALLPGGVGNAVSSLTASSHGTGDLVAAALDTGARRLVLGIGGSASTDGGTGMATVLGARFLSADGTPLAPGGAALCDLDRIDLSGLDPRLPEVEILVARDVDNPLTGPSGAAAVFAPQKGAGPAEVHRLGDGLRRLAEVVRRDLGVDVESIPGGGAAGGVGAGAVAFLGSRLVPGIDLVLDLVDFDDAVEGASLVVSGEGCLDEQSLGGKAPVGVARRAARRGVPVVLLAGRVLLDDAARCTLRELGVVAAHALTDLEPDVAAAQSRAAEVLRDLAGRAVAPVLSDLPDVPTPELKERVTP